MVSPLFARDPTELGVYSLTGRLGSGGFGVVYAGTDPDGSPVAIKLLNPELAADPSFRARLAREGEAMAAVDSDRVARVVEVVTKGDDAYLVMELVEGTSLELHVEADGPLRGPELWFASTGLVDALTAIHRAGIVHRDFKPANVMYGVGGVKVLDFGISTVVAENPHTRTGTFMASAAWISPEQIRDERATPASDVFMLGLVLAFAATGEHPFGSGRADAVMFRIARDEPSLDAITEPLRTVVAACLAKDPEQRPTVEALTAFFRSGGTDSLQVAQHSGPHGTFVVSAGVAAVADGSVTATEVDLADDGEVVADDGPANEGTADDHGEPEQLPDGSDTGDSTENNSGSSDADGGLGGDESAGTDFVDGDSVVDEDGQELTSDGSGESDEPESSDVAGDEQHVDRVESSDNQFGERPANDASSDDAGPTGQIRPDKPITDDSLPRNEVQSRRAAGRENQKSPALIAAAASIVMVLVAAAVMFAASGGDKPEPANAAAASTATPSDPDTTSPPTSRNTTASTPSRETQPTVGTSGTATTRPNPAGGATAITDTGVETTPSSTVAITSAVTGSTQPLSETDTLVTTPVTTVRPTPTTPQTATTQAPVVTQAPNTTQAPVVTQAPTTTSSTTTTSTTTLPRVVGGDSSGPELQDFVVSDTSLAAGESLSYSASAIDPSGVSSFLVALSDGSGNAVSWLNISHGTRGTTSEDLSSSVTVPAGATNGTYSLTLRVFDVLGNETSAAPVSITITGGTTDSSGPELQDFVVSDTSLAAGESLSYSASAIDPSGVSSFLVALSDGSGNAVSWLNISHGTRGTTSEDLSSSVTVPAGATNGTYSLTLRVFDVLGNETSAAPVSITITGGTTDSSGPELQDFVVSDTSLAAGESLSYSASAIDPSGVSSFLVALSDGSGNAVSWLNISHGTRGTTSEDLSSSVTVPAGATNGTYSLTLRVFDVLGNETSAAPVSITIT